MSPEMRQAKLHTIASTFKRAADISVTMRNRLFAFLVALVITMVLGIATVVLMSGLLSADSEAKRFVGQELSNITNNLTKQLGDTSVQLVWLSESLSKSIEYQLSDRQLQTSDLQRHPEILEDILGNELSRLQLALEKTKCSGVFMVLDVTVNPTLPNAENSRAGFYIRNSEPAVVGADVTRLYLRGFPRIALQNNLSLQSKWDMEFNIENQSYWHKPLEKYRETSLPLSRLYYWDFEGAIPDLGEDVVLCSIPLVDSGGEPFGVCGFEISATNFKLNYTPDEGVYKRLVYTFSRVNETNLDTCPGLFSGHNTAFCGGNSEGALAYTENAGKLCTYTRNDGMAFVGMHEQIKLYPDDSAFAGQHFAAALLMPKEDLDAEIFQSNMQLVLVCASLLILGITVSFYISKRYLRPIIHAFDTISSDDLDDTYKTNMLEINQLIEQIKVLRVKGSPLPDDLFEDFIARVRTLTPTELEIFRHYLEKKSIKEILSLMYISANTLKAHNKHIYMKLNVSSRDELLLYIELIKKSGRVAEII